MPDPRPPGDDWLLDDVDWDEPRSRSSRESPAGETPVRQRSGLIPEAGRGAADQPSGSGELHADIRRRRIAALAALAVLLGCAIIIPLVVLGGGGGNSAEPATPVTTTPTTTTAPTTTQTRPSTTTTTPTTTSAALRVTLPAGTTRLERGDSGAAVTQLQKGLVALGFSAGQPDGNFGSVTEAAVVDFQQSNDLTPDGIVGADTVRLLNVALARQSAGSG